MTDQPAPVHGCTIDGRPAMLILVTEYNELVARAVGAQPELDRLTAELGDYDERAEQQKQRADQAEAATTRVTALYEQWVKAGPPPLGVSTARWWDRRLVELRDSIHASAEQPQEAP